MLALRERQLAFGDALLHCGGYAHEHVRGQGIAPEQRLAIYRNSFYENLIGVLRATYPVVEQLVGENFFRAAAERHVRSFPSLAGDLRRYGDGFAYFLERYEPAAGLPYLPDVARLEWAWGEAFSARDEGPLDLSGLARLAPESWTTLALRLASHARVLASDYPLLQIWQMHQDGGADRVVDLGAGSDRVLVLRRALQVELHPLTASEHAWLAALRDGLSLTRALEAALAADAHFELQPVLQKHLCLGTFAGWQICAGAGSGTEHD